MLEELRTTQMEHELREDGELRRETEGVGVIGGVGGELSAQADERAIDPAENVGNRLRMRQDRERDLFQ